MKSYNCATCGRANQYAGKLPNLYPFCCERCQMADLGLWFNERYLISRDLTPEEIGDAEITWLPDRDDERQ